MAHTKGPWKIKGGKNGLINHPMGWTVDYDGDYDIVTSIPIMAGNRTVGIAVDKDTFDDSTVESNAALMALAPELLAFVERYIDISAEVTARGTAARPSVKQLNTLLDMAHKLKKKARGQS